MIRAVLTRYRAARHGGDQGLTLIEIIVATGLLTFVGAIMTSSISALSTSVVKQANKSNATDAVRSAYMLLDKQAHYADNINTPTMSNGKLYVELELPSGTAAGGGLEPGCSTGDTVVCCVQWRYDPGSGSTTGSLSWRSWKSGGTVPTTFTPVASSLSAPSSASGYSAVFSLDPTPTAHEVLDAAMVANIGSGTKGATSALTASFTAYNSLRNAAPPTGSEICNPGTGWRP